MSAITQFLADGVPRGGRIPNGDASIPGVFIANPGKKGKTMSYRRRKKKRKKNPRSGAKRRKNVSRKTYKRRTKRRRNPSVRRKRRRTSTATRKRRTYRRRRNPSVGRKRRYSPKRGSYRRRRRNPEYLPTGSGAPKNIQQAPRMMPFLAAGVGGFALPGMIAKLIGKSGRKSFGSFWAKDKNAPTPKEMQWGQASLSAIAFFGSMYATDKIKALKPYRNAIVFGTGMRAVLDLANATLDDKPSSMGGLFRRLLALPLKLERPPELLDSTWDAPAGGVGGYEDWALAGYENWDVAGYENWDLALSGYGDTSLLHAPVGYEVDGYDAVGYETSGYNHTPVGYEVGNHNAPVGYEVSGNPYDNGGINPYA